MWIDYGIFKKNCSGRLMTSKKATEGQAGLSDERRGMSLRSKLLLMLLAAGMTSVVTISYLGYRHGEQQLIFTAFEKLNFPAGQ